MLYNTMLIESRSFNFVMLIESHNKTD